MKYLYCESLSIMFSLHKDANGTGVLLRLAVFSTSINNKDKSQATKARSRTRCRYVRYLMMYDANVPEPSVVKCCSLKRWRWLGTKEEET